MQYDASPPKHGAVLELEQPPLEPPNSYLLLRESKIARNKDRLAKLGLANSTKSKRIDRNMKSKTLSSASSSLYSPTPVVVGIRRRSSRLRNSTSDGDDGTGGISTHTRGDSRNERRDDGRSMELQSTKTTTTRKRGRESTSSSSQRPIVERPLEPGFTRSTTIDVHTILFNGGMIGRRLKSTGKAIVVNSSARLSNERFSNNNNKEGRPSSSDGTMLRFNKYSGICEWKNDVIFLWVNIGAPGSEVVNEFLQGGKQITWFGGSRMHQHTPAIQNLLRIGKMVSSSNNNHPDVSAARVDNTTNGGCSNSGGKGGIVLWCRVYDQTKRTFLPYTCLGRVGYRSHDPDVHPIQFVWDLLDYEVLVEGNMVVNGEENGVDNLRGKNAFEQIMIQANE